VGDEVDGHAATSGLDEGDHVEVGALHGRRPASRWHRAQSGKRQRFDVRGRVQRIVEVQATWVFDLSVFHHANTRSYLGCDRAGQYRPCPMKGDVRSVEVPGGQVSVHVRMARSPALVLLHYWGGSHRTFDAVVDNIKCGSSVVSYDQRGWGAARELPGPYGIDQMADDALAVVTALDIDSFVLVGHSMGGKVAQLAASRRPVGLRGLVLVAPAPPHPNVDAIDAERRAHAYDTRATVSAALDRALSFRPLRPHLREQVLADSLAADPEAIRAWPMHGLRDDITDKVRLIDVPVRVLAGQHDRVDPPGALEVHLLPFLSNVDIRVIDNTGHLSPLEAPQKIASQIDQFVASLEPCA
jgi:pimeloyl-ACP methyl ester carboxylesterase